VKTMIQLAKMAWRCVKAYIDYRTAESLPAVCQPAASPPSLVWCFKSYLRNFGGAFSPWALLPLLAIALL